MIALQCRDALQENWMEQIKQVAIAVMFSLLLSACGPTPASQRFERLSAHGLYDGTLSQDARLALISAQQEGITLWDLALRKPRFRWVQPASNDNLVLFTRFNDDGRLALTASRNAFAIWDTDSGHARGYWSIADGSIQDIALSHFGRFVLIGLDNAKVIHLDLSSGRRLEFLGHTDKVNSVALSANGRYALSGGNDYQALLWDSRSGQVLRRWIHGSRVTMVALDTQGQFAFTSDSRNQASVWRLSDGQRQSRLQLHARQQIFSTARFNANGSLLLTGAPSRLMQVWDSLTGEPLAKYAVQPQPDRPRGSAIVLAVALDGREQIPVSLASSGYLEYWPPTGVTHAFEGTPSPAHFSPGNGASPGRNRE